MNDQAKRNGAKTLPQYTRTVNEHGVMVRAECLRIRSGHEERLEIRLDAAGQRAVIDVILEDLPILDELLERYAATFAAAVSLRLDGGRLR